MSVERTIYCEGPDCGGTEGGLPCHVRAATPPPYVPGGFIETRIDEPGGPVVIHHFCGWDCVMKFAAAQEQPTVLTWDEMGFEGGEGSHER